MGVLARLLSIGVKDYAKVYPCANRECARPVAPYTGVRESNIVFCSVECATAHEAAEAW